MRHLSVQDILFVSGVHSKLDGEDTQRQTHNIYMHYTIALSIVVYKWLLVFIAQLYNSLLAACS